MTWTILPCLLLAVGFGMAILPAIRADRAEAYHAQHRPESNCPDCEGEVSDMEALAAMQGLGMATRWKARQLIREIQSTTPDTPEGES